MIKYLDAGNDTFSITGTYDKVLDFGGTDTYILDLDLSESVTVVDNQISEVRLPAGLLVDSVRFAADGVQFSVLGKTVTFLGQPQSFNYYLGDNTETPLSFSALAAEFGTTVPAAGAAPNEVSQSVMIQADGGIAPMTTVEVTAGNTNPSDASEGDFYFDIHPGDYHYSIAGFGAGDVLAFPSGNAPTLVNDDFDDGMVEFNWVGEGGLVRIELTGLSASDDAQLLDIAAFQDLFGATSIL
ncbi:MULTISPECIES: hypothetical protein [Thiorhodovibrio]|uniref:hypothetical protein n=1 Tax=Thiorhodovibrio TaxID=61593 RepID=UPI001912CD71|nr:MULTISPECIES: hypothetical protein [Thiorhodovibrio]MBK5969647.1 hypothetical protein [Thiorhodovibrio winogradskyi]WPL14716.1 hypothetical protein Thiosp_04571 [Thiorhodovibrio litoralis]